MQIATVLAQLLSAVAFLFYGTYTLLSPHMAAEFERYRLGRLRVLTAVIQVAGSLSLVAGFWSPSLLLLAAGGFTVMMLLALAVRLRIGDPLPAMAPAFVLLCLNLLLVVRAIA